MNVPDTLPRMYEELANHYARHGESRQRDNCLVLAADAALAAGLPEEAERLRKRLLLTNPHHLLRPYASMAEALQSADVRDFVADLRRQLPPETVAKLVAQSAPAKTLALAEPVAAAAASPKPAPTPLPRAKPAARPPEAEAEPPSPASILLAMAILSLGVALALGLLFVAVIGPLLDP